MRYKLDCCFFISYKHILFLNFFLTIFFILFSFLFLFKVITAVFFFSSFSFEILIPMFFNSFCKVLASSSALLFIFLYLLKFSCLATRLCCLNFNDCFLRHIIVIMIICNTRHIATQNECLEARKTIACTKPLVNIKYNY